MPPSLSKIRVDGLATCCITAVKEPGSAKATACCLFGASTLPSPIWFEQGGLLGTVCSPGLRAAETSTSEEAQELLGPRYVGHLAVLPAMILTLSLPDRYIMA